MQKKIGVLSKKDQLITSMAKKLADVSTVGDLEKIKKKRIKKKSRIYIVVVLVVAYLAATIYTVEKTRGEEKLQRITVASLATQDSPLNRLTDAFKKDEINVDEYAMYLCDLLVKYDSLPEKFKTDRPIILNEDVYRSLMGVWMQLRHQTRDKLVKNLTALNSKVEKLLDSVRG